MSVMATPSRRSGAFPTTRVPLYIPTSLFFEISPPPVGVWMDIVLSRTLYSLGYITGPWPRYDTHTAGFTLLTLDISHAHTNLVLDQGA